MLIPTLGHRLPRSLSRRIFGDRERYGTVPPADDNEWQEWQRVYPDYYQATQKKSIGAYLNHAGYRVMKRIDLTGKSVLEIGPGQIEHWRYWRGKPSSFTAVDVREDFLTATGKKMSELGVDFHELVVSSPAHRAFMDSKRQFDVVISFFNFEHVHPFGPLADDVSRMLKPGGHLIGAIPGEGGLAWGLGRMLTTRRFVRKRYGLDYDKIICWEHPNFAETILDALYSRFKPKYVGYFPFLLPIVDINAVVRFHFQK